jgi:hypothetical protein
MARLGTGEWRVLGNVKSADIHCQVDESRLVWIFTVRIFVASPAKMCLGVLSFLESRFVHTYLLKPSWNSSGQVRVFRMIFKDQRVGRTRGVGLLVIWD